MGFIFLLIVISAIVGIMRLFDTSEVFEGIKTFLICMVATLCLMGIIWGDSYGNTIGMASDIINIRQQGNTVEIYAKKGLAGFKDNSGPQSITDLKYNNYQTQIGAMMSKLQEDIADYNEDLIGKTIMKQSWFWGWCIFSPPEGAEVQEVSNYIK